MAKKDHYQIPILSGDNHKIWFQDTSFKLCGKEIFYVMEITLREYAWMKRVNSTTSPQMESSKSTASEESDINKLASKFEELGRTYNLDKKRVFEHNQVRAFRIISMSFGEDDKETRGKYKLDIKGFYISLKIKYQKMSQSTVSIYIIKISTFVFDAEKGICVG
jgi:hypothetical protein